MIRKAYQPSSKADTPTPAKSGSWIRVLILILCAGLIIYMWLISSMVNISEAYFRDSFIYRDNPKDEFRIVPKVKFNWKMVKYGESEASRSRLLVVSLVRNCSCSIKCMEKKIATLSSVFKSVHVVCFENNSTDDTRVRLLEYANGSKQMSAENVKVTVVNPFTFAENEVSCTLNSADFNNNDKAGIKGASSGRIGRMTFLRNRVLEYVYQHQSEYDVLLMTDLDIIGRIFPTGIRETVGYLKSMKDIGFVTFRGFFPSGGFFDPFSYRGTDWLSQSKFTTLLLCMKGYYTIPSGKGMYPVASSHSGGIFCKLPLAPGLSYSAEHIITLPGITSVYMCEHVSLMEKVKNNFVNTNMSFLVQDNV